MTFYQKVKAALKEHGGPITYPRLAEEMDADEEAVRLTLVELKRRGKAKASGREGSGRARGMAPVLT